jgi:hypothetical protein
MIIETFGLQHFCIKNANPVAALKKGFKLEYLSAIQTADKIDFEFIYGNETKNKNFILLTNSSDWSYLIWNQWDFNSNIDLAEKLSETLKTKVNYYFVDSYIATARWIFADQGVITRAYFESHEQKIFDIGNNEQEDKLRADIKVNFVEDIFWKLYEQTCISIDSFNKQNSIELMFYSGTFSDNENNS